MRLQRLTNYLLHHPIIAMVLTFLITYIPVIGVANILIAALFTLCQGVFEGAVFTFFATLPYVIVFMTSSKSALPQVIWATVVISAVSNLLTWVFAVMLRKGASWGTILQVAALMGVLIISVIHLVYPSVDAWWMNQLQSFYTQSSALIGMTPTGQQAAPVSESPMDTINALKQIATGLVVTFILLTAVLQLVVARWWQASVFAPGSLRKELHRVHLSKLAGFLFLLSMVFYCLGNRVILDIMPVLCLLFSVAGLSLAHYLCSLMKPANGRFWLAVLYVSLMYAMIVIAMLPLFVALNVLLPVFLGAMILIFNIVFFAMMGLLDVWLDFRKKYRQI